MKKDLKDTTINSLVAVALILIITGVFLFSWKLSVFVSGIVLLAVVLIYAPEIK